MKTTPFLTTICFFLISAHTIFAQNTYVPDNNFEQALIDLGYDSGELNDSVATDSITGITNLDVHNKNISSLQGIEDFLNLTVLDCSSNMIAQLDLNKNTQLSHLVCAYNQLSTFTVDSVANLEILECYNNQLSTLDVSSNLKLYYLHCSNNQLSSLDVSTNTNLTNLLCASNQINELDLNSNTSLVELHCGDNQLAALDVSNNSQLTTLYCYGNNLSSLNIQNGNNSNMASHDMFAHDNPALSCIQVDDAATAETYSNWSKDEWATYSEDCSNFDLGRTYVPDDNFEQALIDLGYDSGEPDDSVSTASVKSITNLELHGKNISSLQGIEDFENLTMFSCSSNQLTELNLNKNIHLNWIRCGLNQLSTVNIDSLSNLETFLCYNNQLTALDLSSNLQLTTLECSNNQLGSLDLSNNSQLITLSCHSNNLTSLNLKNGNNSNMAAQDMDAHNNPNLICIQVDDAATAETYSNWNIDDWASYSEDCTPVGAGVPVEEYNSLIDIYNSTAGYLWNNNSNWLDTINYTVDDWYGVTVVSGHVTSLDLGNNYLQNSIFDNPVNLPEVKWIDISENILHKINYSNIESLSQLDSFLINNNNLIFQEIIPAFSLSNYSAFSSHFYYSPQNKLGFDDEFYEENAGSPFTFSFHDSIFSTNDEFQWYKDGQKLTSQTDSILYIHYVTKNDSGSYYLEVTNPDIPDLTLKSHYISLYVNSAGAGIPIAEYNSLIDLYESTLGEEWTNNTSWLDTTNYTVDDWYGVSATNGHVIRIELPNNNLQHDLILDKLNLPQLRSLNVANNQLFNGGFEHLDLFPNLDSLTISGNNFNFEDVRPVHLALEEHGYTKYFKYDPQRKFGAEESFHLPKGTSVMFSYPDSVFSQNDIFQWYKNNTLIEGATDSILYISSVNESDSALYHLQITNTFAPRLTLISHYKILSVDKAKGAGIPVSEYNALVDFYINMNGNNWLNNDNWLDTIYHNVDDWYGIGVENGHVSEIGFNNINVKGEIPQSITNLSYLKLASFNKCYIENKISDNLITIPALTNVFVRDCNLTDSFDDIISNSNDSLQILNVELNNITGTIPENIGNKYFKQIWITGNNITGQIPASIGNLSELFVFYAGDNGLNGQIPPEFGNIAGIQTVVLSNNQIEGPLPVELKNLVNLEDFLLDKNLIGNNSSLKNATVTNRQIPDDLSNLISLNQLNINDNKLQFNDVESVFSWNNFEGLEGFIYSPQDSIGIEKSIEGYTGQDILFSIDNYFPGPSDEYQWYKDNERMPWKTKAELELFDIQLSDAGQYRCKITNPVADELTLYSRKITLNVSESAKGARVPFSEYETLAEIYSNTNGGEWLNNENWLDTTNYSVAEWHGIKVENEHVTGFEMSGNNLSQIPDLQNLPNLKIIDISSGEFSGHIPNYENLDSLHSFSLTENNFTFDDLMTVTEWKNYDNFNADFSYSPQSEIHISGTDTVNAGDSILLELPDYEAHIADHFEWFINDIPLDSSNSATSTKKAWYEDNNAVFHCEITNPNLPQLTLISEPLAVTVIYNENDSSSLAALQNEYEVLQNLWAENPLALQNHITIHNGAISKINLSGLNLEGNISLELAGLDSLTWLDLSNNNLGGAIPSFLNNNKSLSELIEEGRLEYLNISGNNFVFTDMEPVANELNAIPEFIYSPQSKIGEPLNTFVYENQSISLELKNYFPSDYDTYKWMKDGEAISGTSDFIYSINSATLQDSGFYTCEVTNLLFPGLTLYSDTISLKVKLAVGINELQTKQPEIYPNPATNRIYVDTKNQKTDIKIFNIAGTVVFEKNVLPSGWINVKSYPSGIYIFSFTGEKGIINKKVIIK